MASTEKSLEDLNLTSDEIKNLTNAFKNEEFRKLFKEYADEIADPENRRRYEEEIQAMENERGMNVEFVHPEPGYVLKTTVDGDTKAFINVCKNDKIDKPSTKRATGPDGKSGLSWSIPHSFSPPRDELDKKGGKVKVFDFVIHPDTYRMSESNARFKQMINDTAFDGIERQFGFKVDRQNAKLLRMQFKGTPSPTVIRSRSDQPPKPKDPNDILSSFPYPYDDKTTKEKSEIREKQMKPADDKKTIDEHTTPKYTIKHRSEIDFQDYRNASDAAPSTRPKALVIDIDLPLITAASQVELDIYEKSLSLKSDVPAKYKLALTLPYPVDENHGSAKFDKSKSKLVVTLPVLPPTDQSPCVSSSQSDPAPGGDGVLSSLTNGHQDEEQETTKPLIEVLSENLTADGEGSTKVTSEAETADELAPDT